MWELFLQYFTVYLFSSVKFIGGPVLGIAYGLNFFETAIATVLGMMTSVYLLSYFKSFFRDKFLKYVISEKKLLKNERALAIWDKYGIKGIAFLTPILFSPMIGTILALSFGGARRKVVFYMFISAVFWAVIYCGGIYFFGDYFGYN
jgi:hypothetical protein